MIKMWDFPAISMGSMLENLRRDNIGFHFQLSHQSGVLSGVKSTKSTSVGCFMMWNFYDFSYAQQICHHFILQLSRCSFRFDNIPQRSSRAPPRFGAPNGAPLTGRCLARKPLPRSPGDVFHSKHLKAKPRVFDKNEPKPAFMQ